MLDQISGTLGAFPRMTLQLTKITVSLHSISFLTFYILDPDP